MRRKCKTAAVALCVLAFSLAAGCAPQAAPNEKQPSNAAVAQDAAAAAQDETTPQVFDAGDGVMVQRTPDDNGTTVMAPMDEQVPYNLFYLDADNRGCNSCHADLGALVASLPYQHPKLTNELGIQITVEMCQSCHSPVEFYSKNINDESFASLIHTRHQVNGSEAYCWNCHDASDPATGTMPLWDNVKHDRLRGIVAIADAPGDFSFTQETTTSATQLPSFRWQGREGAIERYRLSDQNSPLDQAIFDQWTISIDGAVDQEMSWTLPDLIANAPSETHVMASQCVDNPVGGPLVGQAEITGIPVSWIYEEAGISPDAKSVTTTSVDGFASTALFEYGKDAYLVYEINGEPLSWENGYPVQFWTTGTGAASFTKQVNQITVGMEGADEVTLYNQGMRMEDGTFTNMPNVGFTDLREGTIVAAGEPFTFTGYAHDCYRTIDTIEFSMDNGATWTRHDTTGTVQDQWINWSYTFTPEEAGAYVLSVRAIASDGTVTPDYPDIMINAKN